MIIILSEYPNSKGDISYNPIIIITDIVAMNQFKIRGKEESKGTGSNLKLKIQN